MKRFSQFGFVFTFCALVFGLLGCATRAPEIKAQGSLQVALSAEKKSTAASAQLFNLVTLTLPPPQARGYHWQISFHDARYLKQTTEIMPAGAAGAGPTISFIAVKPGRTRVRFMLVPVNSNRVVDPLDQQELVLTIDR